MIDEHFGLFCECSDCSACLHLLISAFLSAKPAIQTWVSVYSDWFHCRQNHLTADFGKQAIFVIHPHPRSWPSPGQNSPLHVSDNSLQTDQLHSHMFCLPPSAWSHTSFRAHCAVSSSSSCANVHKTSKESCEFCISNGEPMDGCWGPMSELISAWLQINHHISRRMFIFKGKCSKDFFLNTGLTYLLINKCKTCYFQICQESEYTVYQDQISRIDIFWLYWQE